MPDWSHLKLLEKQQKEKHHQETIRSEPRKTTIVEFLGDKANQEIEYRNKELEHKTKELEVRKQELETRSLKHKLNKIKTCKKSLTCTRTVSTFLYVFDHSSCLLNTVVTD